MSGSTERIHLPWYASSTLPHALVLCLISEGAVVVGAGQGGVLKDRLARLFLDPVFGNAAFHMNDVLARIQAEVPRDLALLEWQGRPEVCRFRVDLNRVAEWVVYCSGAPGLAGEGGRAQVGQALERLVSADHFARALGERWRRWQAMEDAGDPLGRIPHDLMPWREALIEVRLQAGPVQDGFLPVEISACREALRPARRR